MVVFHSLSTDFILERLARFERATRLFREGYSTAELQAPGAKTMSNRVHIIPTIRPSWCPVRTQAQ